jgi:predicted peptidase
VAQTACSFVRGAGKRGRLDYLLHLPRRYAHRRRWPLILFLHGAGERGEDLELVKRHGVPRLAEEDESLPLVAVSPQCPKGERWHLYLKTLGALLDDIVARYSVDPRRIYLSGLSMGGYGTWHLAARYPDRFAALAPICGGGLPSCGFPEKARSLRDVPVWAFHGALDTIVPLEEAQRLVDVLRASGGDVRLTVYPDAGHDSWTRTYADPAFFEWLLAQRRGVNRDRRG